ncbi:MAG: hypothetical protein ABIG95_00705 [Candidatus Woesearchaeota archaeon]
MAKNISKDTPLSEITFRRYEKPGKVTGRNLVRKVCLSVGLLQPGDSRDVVVDVFYVLLRARNRKKNLTSEEIVELVIKSRKRSKLPMLGIAPSNIRRQLLRIRELFFVEKIKNRYRITEFMRLEEIYNSRVKRILLDSILRRVEEHIIAVDSDFKRN